MTTLVTVSLTEKDGQLSVEYQNGDSGTPPSTETIEKLIAALGKVRARMNPPVTQDAPEQSIEQFEAIYDPRFWTEPNSMVSGSSLLFLHPGYGWLSFVIPQESLAILSDLLQRQLGAASQVRHGSMN